eukprot:18883-Heterococcus_DN1.PRE.1
MTNNVDCCNCSSCYDLLSQYEVNSTTTTGKRSRYCLCDIQSSSVECAAGIALASDCCTKPPTIFARLLEEAAYSKQIGADASKTTAQRIVQQQQDQTSSEATLFRKGKESRNLPSCGTAEGGDRKMKPRETGCIGKGYVMRSMHNTQQRIAPLETLPPHAPCPSRSPGIALSNAQHATVTAAYAPVVTDRLID